MVKSIAENMMRVVGPHPGGDPHRKSDGAMEFPDLVRQKKRGGKTSASEILIDSPGLTYPRL